MTTVNACSWRFAKPISEGRCRVLFVGPHFQAAVGYTEASLRRRRLGDRVEILRATTTTDLWRLVPTAHVALPFMEPFSEELLRIAVDLRLVQQFGVGLEGVRVDAASNLKIAVSNVPARDTGNAEATAEHAVFLAIALLRRAPHDLPDRFQRSVLGGLPPPKTLYGQNVTVVGFGNVGRQICRYAHVMGARVTAVRKRPWGEEPRSTLDSNDERNNGNDDNDDDNGDFLERKSNCLEEVLPTTNVLILACPVTEDTKFLMNQTTLGLLPPDALLFNVGRGPLVHYHALRGALEGRRLGGFASDVGVGHDDKPSEPWDPHDPLNALPNVLFTPHVGGYSELSYRRMTEVVVDHIECILHQKPPLIWVNQPSSSSSSSSST